MTMSLRIHPAGKNEGGSGGERRGRVGRDDEVVEGGEKRLTVWKRSSMSFHGTDGFTVFDERGRLVFRVDNYSRNTPDDVVVLMDGVGNALLTLNPNSQMGILRGQTQWNAFRGEDASRSDTLTNATNVTRRRVFCMRSRTSSSLPFFGQRNEESAEVILDQINEGRRTDAFGKSLSPDFRIRGSFRMRNCKITAAAGQTAATVTRKKANPTVSLGDDVFNLVVHRGFDADIIMAFLVVLDRISAKPFLPFLCS